MNRSLSFIAAAAIAVSLLTVISASAKEIKASPQCSSVISSDVNGRITINTPENASAEVTITFDSPEGKGLPYYTEDVAPNSSVSFDIEGRENTENDYRRYSLYVILTLDASESEPFINEFTIPDAYYHEGSFTHVIYNFSADDAITDAPWDKTTNKDGSENILMHIAGIITGDVDNDGKISASDATAVLQEYSSLSTGESGSFTKAQFKAGDVNNDGAINASDASSILAYYAALSTNQEAHW